MDPLSVIGARVSMGGLSYEDPHGRGFSLGGGTRRGEDGEEGQDELAFLDRWRRPPKTEISRPARPLVESEPNPVPDFEEAIAMMLGARAMASGGIVRRPTLALLGEEGPEAVLPLGGPDDADLLAGLEGMGYGRPGPPSYSASPEDRFHASLRRAGIDQAVERMQPEDDEMAFLEELIARREPADLEG